MINAVGVPRSILLLGGRSEIGLAIVHKYLSLGTDTVVIAQRGNNPETEQELKSLGATTVRSIDFDATNVDDHPRVIASAFADEDIDLAIVAFGVLPDAEQVWRNHSRAVQAATVNYLGAVSVGVLLGEQFTRQGHGCIVALSSVAGELIRRSNFFYGSTKAGFDGYYLGLGQALAPAGIHTLVVRPGQVRTKMSAGVKEAPLTVNKEVVADAVIDGVLKKKTLIWVPAPFRVVMSGLRHIPRKILAKLPL